MKQTSEKIDTSEISNFLNIKREIGTEYLEKYPNKVKGMDICGFVLKNRNDEESKDVYLWIGNLDEKDMTLGDEICENHSNNGYSVCGKREELLYGFFDPAKTEIITNDSLYKNLENKDLLFLGMIISHQDNNVSIFTDDFSNDESKIIFQIIKSHEEGICVIEKEDILC